MPFWNFTHKFKIRVPYIFGLLKGHPLFFLFFLLSFAGFGLNSRSMISFDILSVFTSSLHQLKFFLYFSQLLLFFLLTFSHYQSVILRFIYIESTFLGHFILFFFFSESFRLLFSL
jgi:hypothetical protein